MQFWYFLTALTLISALMVVLSKNPIHSVLYLVFTFFCISGHYVLLNAQFLMAVNIIVYAGAIMVLFLFVIMMLDLRRNSLIRKLT
jgi:NADH-quinone oxidoreductase subunit J